MARQKRILVSQPPAGASIDWSNPITRGLVFAQIGDTPRDLVTGSLRTAGAGTPTKGVGRQGRTRSFSSSSDYYAGNGRADTATSYGVFLLCEVSSMSSFSGLLSHTSNLGTNNGWAIFQETGGNLVIYGSAGAQVSLGITSSQVTSAGLCTLAGGYRSSDNLVEIYFNGVTTRSAADNRAAPATGAGYIKVGASRDVDSITGKYYLTLIWNRLPTKAEFDEIRENPWALFSFSKRPNGTESPAAVGAFNPAWAVGSNYLIQGVAR